MNRKFLIFNFQFLIKQVTFVFCFILSGIVFVLSATPALAQQYVPQGKAQVQVRASVGEYYLSVSGFISPYASVALIIDGIYYRGTVANERGEFSISQVLIKKGLTGFCLQAKDFHNLGESYSCFTLPPVTGNIVRDNIFLPPTLALQRSEIAAGDSVLAFGYTMPGATVRLHIGGRILTTIADEEGYYQITITNVPAGVYQLFADATYNGIDSVAPSRFLKLTALGWWDQFLAFLRQIWNWVVNFFVGTGIGMLWIGLPLLLLIFIFIMKIWPDRFTWIYDSKLISFFAGRRRKKLHHAWFVGY